MNLQGSGPYNYRPPVGYFTNLASGFSVETGTPSLATLEAIEAMVPKEDRWPLSDTIAYHDWHFGGNGDIKTFMETLATRYGAGTSLEDFERKAQMMNYETYRAMFEGLQAHLWTKNSGRLLWMTHPAWPSNHWQIYSHDYDTHAAYYGVKKAVEPVHVQMNLPDYSVTVVNSTREARDRPQARHRACCRSTTRSARSREDAVDARANDITPARRSQTLRSTSTQQGMVLVALRLRDCAGTLISDNTYWQGKDDASHQKLNALPQQTLDIQASASTVEAERVVVVKLVNPGKAPRSPPSSRWLRPRASGSCPRCTATTMSPCCRASRAPSSSGTRRDSVTPRRSGCAAGTSGPRQRASAGARSPQAYLQPVAAAQQRSTRRRPRR